MTHFARSPKPGVDFASPTSQPPRSRHASTSWRPAARWIAPSTPPPPSNDEFAALTIASTFKVVMSARNAINLVAMLNFCSSHDKDQTGRRYVLSVIFLFRQRSDL